MSEILRFIKMKIFGRKFVSNVRIVRSLGRRTQNLPVPYRRNTAEWWLLRIYAQNTYFIQYYKIIGAMLSNSKVSLCQTIRIVCFSAPLSHELFAKKSLTVGQTLVSQISLQLNRCGPKVLFLICRTTLQIRLAYFGFLLAY